MYAFTLNGINDPVESDSDFDDSAGGEHWLSFLPETYASTVLVIYLRFTAVIFQTLILIPTAQTGCTTLDDCDVIIRE